VTRFPLEAADEALAELRAGRFSGAVVVMPRADHHPEDP